MKRFRAVASADYDDHDFESCMSRNMPTEYCCEHAGGVMGNGACVDPELKASNIELRQPSRALHAPDTPNPARAGNHECTSSAH